MCVFMYSLLRDIVIFICKNRSLFNDCRSTVLLPVLLLLEVCMFKRIELRLESANVYVVFISYDQK